MSKLESRFLRFRTSSWRSKIDPKRLQERTKNNIKKHRTTRGEKKGNKNDKKRQQEVITIIDKSNFGARGSLGRTIAKNLEELFNNDGGSNTPMAKCLASLPTSPLPPTHLGLACFEVRDLRLRRLEVTNVSRILALRKSICRRGWKRRMS